MKVQVSGGAVLAVAGVAAVGLVGWAVASRVKAAAGAVAETAGKVVDAVNPANPKNLVNQAVGKVAITGGHNGYTWDDHLFAAVDLVNPWNADDWYAKKVWGLDE